MISSAIILVLIIALIVLSLILHRNKNKSVPPIYADPSDNPEPRKHNIEFTPKELTQVDSFALKMLIFILNLQKKHEDEISFQVKEQIQELVDNLVDTRRNPNMFDNDNFPDDKINIYLLERLTKCKEVLQEQKILMLSP